MTDPTPDIVLDRAEQQMRDWERGRSIDIRAVIDLIGDLYTEVRALRDQRDTATDALRHITNGQQCETYTRPPYCRDPQSGRSRDAHYGAERWCDTCIALDALPAVDRPPTGTPDTGDGT